jgi:hypothetical protein
MEEIVKKIIEDWNTIAPEYRTPEKLVDMTMKDFAEQISNILGDFSCRNSGGLAEYAIGDVVALPKQVINQFIIQSHIAYLKGEIEKLQSWKCEVPMSKKNIDNALLIAGRTNYNKALEEQITHLYSQLEEAKKLL